MEIDLIFKIAAIGIIVAVLNQLADPLRAGRSGDDDDTGRAGRGPVHSGETNQRPVRDHQILFAL